MRNLLLMAPLLLFSFPFAVATGSQANNGSHHQTYRGCLDGADGNYMLKATNGMTYELTGDRTGLSKLAGKEVSLTGMEGSASGVSTGVYGHTGEATSNPTAGTAPTIHVKQVMKVADSCGMAKGQGH